MYNHGCIYVVTLFVNTLVSYRNNDASVIIIPCLCVIIYNWTPISCIFEFRPMTLQSPCSQMRHNITSHLCLSIFRQCVCISTLCSLIADIYCSGKASAHSSALAEYTCVTLYLYITYTYYCITNTLVTCYMHTMSNATSGTKGIHDKCLHSACVSNMWYHSLEGVIVLASQ